MPSIQSLTNLSQEDLIALQYLLWGDQPPPVSAHEQGGLLYAGYKKASREQAKNELASINADIEEFSANLMTLQPGSPAVAIAQLQPAR